MVTLENGVINQRRRIGGEPVGEPVIDAGVRWGRREHSPRRTPPQSRNQPGGGDSRVGRSQTRALPSSPVETKRWPLGLKATETNSPRWRKGSLTGRPVFASQTRAVPSCEAVAIRRPLGLKIAIETEPRWSSSAPTGSPVRAFQIRADPSLEAVTTSPRSCGLNWAKLTAPDLEWSSGGVSGAPVSAFQIRAGPVPRSGDDPAAVRTEIDRFDRPTTWISDDPIGIPSATSQTCGLHVCRRPTRPARHPG